MGKKILYQVKANSIASSPYKYNYKYDKTDNIHLFISKNAFSIEVERTINTPSHEILANRLFVDGIKKAHLIHTILYGTSVRVKKLTASIDKSETDIYCASSPDEYLIYCLYGKKLVSPFPNDWKNNNVGEFILSVRTENKEYRLIAALNALTMAKSKYFATEKFMYLWMAMNGLYGYIAQIAKEDVFSKSEESWINKERGQIEFLSIYLGFDFHWIEKGKETEVRTAMESILGTIIETDYNKLLKALDSNNVENSTVNMIHSFFDKNKIIESNPYILLLLWLSYQIRCKYFHSELTLPVYCFSEESPLPALKFLNYLLEQFLDNNLLLFLNNDSLQKSILPRIKNYVQACRWDNHLNKIVIKITEKEAHQ